MGGNGSFGGFRVNAAKGGASKWERSVYIYTRKLRRESESEEEEEGDSNLEEGEAGREWENGGLADSVQGGEGMVSCGH